MLCDSEGSIDHDCDGNLVSTAYYYWSVDIVAKAATMLSRKTEAERYSALARDIAKSFHEKFYAAEKRYYQPSSQTANTLPLFLRITGLGIEPEAWSADRFGGLWWAQDPLSKAIME